MRSRAHEAEKAHLAAPTSSAEKEEECLSPWSKGLYDFGSRCITHSACDEIIIFLILGPILYEITRLSKICSGGLIRYADDYKLSFSLQVIYLFWSQNFVLPVCI